MASDQATLAAIFNLLIADNLRFTHSFTMNFLLLVLVTLNIPL